VFKDHPWQGEEFGPIQYYWHLERQYCVTILFELDNRPLIGFCKQNNLSAHQLVMKIASRLSQKYLPQRVIGVSKKDYPTRYPAGFVRKAGPDRDLLEMFGVREKEKYFAERWLWQNLRPIERFLVKRFPRLAVWLAKHIFKGRDVRNWFALIVSRNPMAGVGFPIIFFGSNYWTHLLTIPFGDQVWAAFGMPHAFANVDYYKEFLAEFKNLYEHPETIPSELLEKRYDQIEMGTSNKSKSEKS